jgi:cytochrome c biogenesis protein CcmG/thiol:disulfide interchange protein DsbE
MPDDIVHRHPSELEPAGPAGRRRRSRWMLVGAVAASVAVLTSLLSFGLKRDPALIRSALILRRAPVFALPTLDGRGAVRLSDLRGQVVVVNFWASWCVDCRIEHPALATAWARYRDQGVVFLGIPFQDSPADSRAYIRELGGGWPVLSDPGERTALAYGVYGVPETYFIAPDGRIAHKEVGPVTYELLTDQITRLLKKASS